MCPETTYEEFSEEAPDGHSTVLENFAEAILEGTELIADGREGLNSLSISNAAYLSSWTDTWAEIPTDEKLFERYLAELCKNESAKKNISEYSDNVAALKERWKVRW